MNYTIDSEISYFAYVIGVDVLKDYTEKFMLNYGVDSAYDECIRIAKNFLNSDLYKNNLKHSSYECLELWLRDNKDILEK